MCIRDRYHLPDICLFYSEVSRSLVRALQGWIGPVGKLEYICKNILKAKGHEQDLYVNGCVDLYLATNSKDYRCIHMYMHLTHMYP